MFEKRCGATPQKITEKCKTSVSQIKPSQFRVIARPSCGRGNLEVIDVASRSEARFPREMDFKHFGNKNGRFYCKTYHFRVIARPQSGRGNLKVIDVESRSEARERKTTKSPNSDPSRRDTTTALPRTRHFTRAQARISHASVSFTRSKIVFHCAALPCLVPGCRPVPSKIAASGARALLAMTESVGFSKKRYSFQNEMFEKRCRAAPHKKTAYNKKRPFSKQNRPNFVSLRGRPAAVAILK